MATKKKVTRFFVDAKIVVETNCLVTANSLEEAISKGRELKVTDFVDILGAHNASDVELQGVFES